MKNLNTKKIFAVLGILFLSNFIYSLPAVSPQIQDISGEYVYYSDKTFSDKSNSSIVGFIYYDDENYAMRYFSSATNDSKNPHLEKDISVYIKLNAQNPKVEFLGERIIGATSSEDADIVNYLHDLFYEFSERRQKLEFSSETKKLSINQDFPQFGGNVNLNFNIYIPIFNLESIKASDGKVLFEVLTCGKLSNSQDSSFETFKGVQGLPKDKKRNFKTSSKAKKLQVNFETDFNSKKIVQNLTLDETWKAGMENLWLLGDYALLSLSVIQNPQQNVPNLNQENFSDILIRRFIQSTNQSYALFPYLNLEQTENSVKITNVFFEPQTQNVTRDIKILTRLSDSEEVYALLTLTMFDNVYQKNKKYFTSILSTYKIN